MCVTGAIHSSAALSQSSDAVLVTAVPPPARSATCVLPRQASGVAIEVIDAVTLRLSDGLVIRLAGLIAPAAPLATPIDALSWAPEMAAKQALKDLTSDQTGLEIAVADPKVPKDRYGRTVAHLVATRNGQQIWIQGALLKSGHAQVSSRIGGATCLTEMLAIESEGRTAHVGLWAHPAHAVLDAANTEALKRHSGSFAIVEGTVSSVAQRAERTYVNFGTNWKWDFTATVPKAVLGTGAEAASKLAALKGHRVRVRGWIELHNGPSLDVNELAELEDLDPGSAISKAPVPGQ